MTQDRASCSTLDNGLALFIPSGMSSKWKRVNKRLHTGKLATISLQPGGYVVFIAFHGVSRGLASTDFETYFGPSWLSKHKGARSPAVRDDGHAVMHLKTAASPVSEIEF